MQTEVQKKEDEGFPHSFIHRHLGSNKTEQDLMLKALSASSLESFVKSLAPKEMFNVKKLNLPKPFSESELIEYMRNRVQENKVFKNYIGQGFYECQPLAVTNRNIIKNPLWLTAYTPYQPEISQGRLEALLNFQTLMADLMGMEMANAGLLDEASASAEALIMAYNIKGDDNKKCLFVEQSTLEFTKNVLKNQAGSLGLSIQEGSLLKDKPPKNTFAVFFQYPLSSGLLPDFFKTLKVLKSRGVLLLVSADPLACTLLKPPGEWGADIAVGSSGRLGLPLLYGGPHAGFLACKKEFKSFVPGRIVGVSQDKEGRQALRLALQTREQHIRRERATSNICTAQALPAVLSSFYAVYHGPKGLKAIAQNIHNQTMYLYNNLKKLNLEIVNHTFFDTLTIRLKKDQIPHLKKLSEKTGINLGYGPGELINISIGEGKTKKDMDELISLFKEFLNLHSLDQKSNSLKQENIGIPLKFLRTSSYLTHPVFNTYHSEAKLVRYIHHLQNKDITLAHSMIPLGSCTMKLNATTQLQPMTWRGFADIHPFQPLNQVKGSLNIFKELEKFLCEITGFKAFTLQPNAGSQGEYAGLMVFKKYHQHIGESKRNICLIPNSAHGTNPASAKKAGLTVVNVKCNNSTGGVDIEDLSAKIKQYSDKLSCLMLTYPSTCGVFEKDILKICNLIQGQGAFVYFDGANMNALLGFCRPADLGFSAGHLNLHKTFCIPHGGGGPGAGPLGVIEKLKPFLPVHPFIKKEGWSLNSSPYGNAGVLSIPWSYIRLMGFEGLKKASALAVLNANYIVHKLKPYYKILYTGEHGGTAHECIVDFRKFKYSSGVEVVDIAKRLMDYGFHAPTMSWPVPGTLMIEPTESEDKEEIDRFCEAMISIRKEIAEVENKKFSPTDNVLKNAPHTVHDLAKEKWTYPYSKEKACFPLKSLKEKKFWPPVSRIKEAYGDINLFCSCPPVE